jgi:hypothetical protein
VSLWAHFFSLYFIYQEIPIFTENGVIEIIETMVLVLCILRCVQYAVQSRLKQGRCFWLASVLVFFSVIRRELSHLSDSMVPPDFIFLGYSYDWWEDMVLLVIIVVMLGLLAYSWRYFWSVLKNTSKFLYLSVIVLALIQYMGENAIIFPYSLGIIIEELAENIIYIIALIYLWTFTLTDFERRVIGISVDK